MIPHVKRSIGRKLLLMVLAANLSALLVTAGALTYYESLEFHDALLADLSTQADILGKASTAALQFNDEKAARENLAQLHAKPIILAAALYTAKGATFASYRRDAAAAEPIPTLSDPDGMRIEDGRMRLFARVASQDEVLGSVYLLARYDLAERLWHFLAVLAAAMVASLGVGLAVAFRVKRLIVSPVQAISEVACQVIEQRDFELRATRTTDDEVGTLADAFNAMLAEIGRRTEAIESSKLELEREVTERREVQKSLQASECRNRTLVSAMSSVIWVSGPYGGFEDAQDPWAAYTGQTPDQYRDLGWRRAFHPDDQASLERTWARAINRPDPFELEARLQSAGSGRYREVILRSAPIRDEEGLVVEWIGAIDDVDDRREAEREVQELNAQLERRVAERTAQLEVANRELTARTEEAVTANRAKADFLANMSHEIRTPMNAILGLAYLLEKHELTAVARAMVQKIHIAGRSLLGIINDILDFSKIDAQKLEIEDVPFRLSDVLDNLANIMSSSVGEKAIEVVVGPAPEGADFLRGDALRLGQVLINLATNAIKFTAAGEVVVGIERLDQGAPDEHAVRLRFAVRDTGIGIAPDKQRTIFSAFTQADSSTTRSYGGTGLGLAISSRLVELLGGELRLHSEPGRGSEFSFEISLEVSDPDESATPKLMFQRVLVADDNATARAVLSATAASLGWSVDAVDSGRKAIEAIARAGNHPYDLLLLDWRMPELDGLATAVAIREKPVTAPVAPIIVMVTAFDRELLLGQSGSEQVDLILTKPVTSSCLYNALMDAKVRRGELSSAATLRPGSQRLPGRRILVVDDSEINRDVAMQILAGEGAEVELAAEGAAALAALQDCPEGFDLVLMDVQMPVMDGYETTRRIRATPSLARLPVIALTAGAFKKQQVAAINAGMDDFVAKPFDVDELIEAVLRLTGGRGHGAEAGGDGPPAAPRDFEPAGDDGPGPALLDKERGLRHWRNETMYQDRLRTFMQRYVDDGRRIVAALRADELGEAEFIAHKLKGSAGALALLRVAGLAGAIEDALHAGRDASRLAPELLTALEQTAAVIHDYAGQGTTTSPESWRGGETSAIGERFAHLRKALDSDDPELVEPLLPALSGGMSDCQLQELRARIDAFDFRGAEALIDEMSAMLGLRDRSMQ